MFRDIISKLGSGEIGLNKHVRGIVIKAFLEAADYDEAEAAALIDTTVALLQRDLNCEKADPLSLPALFDSSDNH